MVQAWTLQGVAALSALVAAAPAAAVIVVGASPAQQVSSVAPGGNAVVLDQARATAFFGDGSSASALFIAASSSLATSAVAQVAGRFNVVAQSSSPGSNEARFFVTNLSLTQSLVGFRIDGGGDGAGHAAFDRNDAFNGIGSTTGSNDGVEFTVDLSTLPASARPADTTRRYDGAIGLAGAAPVGDLYRVVEARFELAGPFAGQGLPPNTNISFLNFRVDLDTVSYVSAVPEPASVLTLLAGLGLLSACRRRG